MGWFRRRTHAPSEVGHDTPPEPGPPPSRDELRRRALRAARRRLTDLRETGKIGDAALEAVEDDLRRIELRAFLGKLYPD